MSEERRCPECWHKEISHIEELGVCVAWVTDNGHMCGCEYRFALAGCLRVDYRGMVSDLDDMQRRADTFIYAHTVHPNHNSIVVFRDNCVSFQNEICRSIVDEQLRTRGV